MTLAGVALAAGAALAFVWIVVAPQSGELPFELAKVCLQIIGVTVIGGLVTVASSHAQQSRQEALAAEAERRKEEAAAVERQREAFRVRASLLERATRCAQEMFITCQHVRRVQRDVQEGAAPSAAQDAAHERLDLAYLQFSTAAAAVETEVGARFRQRWVEGDGPGEAFLRWHQVTDLLTVYYFALRGSFRGNVLASNSKGRTNDDVPSAEAGGPPRDGPGPLHSGIDFVPMVHDPRRPSSQEIRIVRGALRKEFWAAMPRFAAAVVQEEIRDL